MTAENVINMFITLLVGALTFVILISVMVLYQRRRLNPDRPAPSELEKFLRGRAPTGPVKSTRYCGFPLAGAGTGTSMSGDQEDNVTQTTEIGMDEESLVGSG